MSQELNIRRTTEVARLLGELNQKVVFVGGATLSMYATRKILEVRPTEDVDIIVEILNYTQRADLEEKLRAIGFTNDIQSGIVCRWSIDNISVDIMPTDEASVGFTNRWYAEGFKNAIKYTIDDSCTIQILNAPYFVATKFEAFKSRGNNDGRTSHDFEDIVFVMENRKEIWREIELSPKDLRTYLSTEFRTLVNNTNIYEWINCNVERYAPAATTNDILGNITRLAGDF
ncbi:MAG: hypothetical protein EBZ77_15365 [Chitinophagia bacterium]|nr:hypothetical protein [Chitinophagia bacterium]